MVAAQFVLYRNSTNTDYYHLGTGSYSHVWKARGKVIKHPQTLKIAKAKTFAIKQLRADLPAYLDTIYYAKKEAGILSKLSHIKILHKGSGQCTKKTLGKCSHGIHRLIHGYGFVENSIEYLTSPVFTTMPYFDGLPLSNLDIEFNRQGLRISLNHIHQILEQILQGLAILADNHMLHGDLSLKNILFKLKPDGNIVIKIIDLGFCNEIPHGGLRPRRVLQTYNIRHPKSDLMMALGNEIDLFSLGCILFEIITRYELFPFKDTQYERIKFFEKLHILNGIWPDEWLHTPAFPAFYKLNDDGSYSFKFRTIKNFSTEEAYNFFILNPMLIAAENYGFDRTIATNLATLIKKLINYIPPSAHEVLDDLENIFSFRNTNIQPPTYQKLMQVKTDINGNSYLPPIYCCDEDVPIQTSEMAIEHLLEIKTDVNGRNYLSSIPHE